MRNLKKTRLVAIQWIAVASMLMLSSLAQSQCDNCPTKYRLEKYPDRNEKVLPPNGHFLSKTGLYEGCKVGSNNARNVTFVHGLGGDGGSWEKPATWTYHNFRVGVDKANYSGKGLETSFYSVSKFLNAQIGANLAFGINQGSPNRCNKDDYVIAHSQGGLASRHLDRYWDTDALSFGNRKFYGLVTFGCPHGGADIALSLNQHNQFIRKVVSSVVLHSLNETIYDLTGKIGFLFGSKLTDLTTGLDTLIEKKIVPALVSSLHTGTLNEMTPNSVEMNRINTHESRLRKVCFFGVEEAPECWRVLDDIVTKGASTYPVFQANSDATFVKKIESVRFNHIGSIASNEAKIKALGKKFFYWSSVKLMRDLNQQLSLMIENRHRKKALDFLNNANTEWRYLIGSYHPDSFEYVTLTSFEVHAQFQIGQRVVHSIRRGFQTMQEAKNWQSKMEGHGFRTVLRSISTTKKHRQFFPSDGVVLAKSQVAFPGVAPSNIDMMRNNNHFQERNSSETERVLLSLYSGKKYDPYFKLEPR